MNNGIEMQENSGATNGNLDYDLIADVSGGTVIRWNNANYTSLSSFLARGGNTTWSHALSMPAAFVNAATGDFHSLATSPSRDAATALALFDYDLENRSRPQGLAFDIGAYEYSAGDMKAPSAPTNLRIAPP